MPQSLEHPSRSSYCSRGGGCPHPSPLSHAVLFPGRTFGQGDAQARRPLSSSDRLSMEVGNYGAMGPGDPAQPVWTNPAMAPGYPPAMNPAMAPTYYPTMHADPLAPPTAPYPHSTAIPGYEGIDGGDGAGKCLPPPPPIGPAPDSLPEPANNWRIPCISQETAKRALLDYANSQCCYGTSPAEEMEIREMKPFNTYRYRLETFTESRSCEWVNKPLTSKQLDTPANGLAPPPWDIIVEPPSLFHDEVRKMPVPHTTSKKQCPECNGKGKVICETCNGNSQVNCDWCGGSGSRGSDDCSSCNGSGRKGCRTCNQSNVQTCRCCSGEGQVMTFIELTVTWANKVFEFIPDHHSEFPSDLFSKVSGEKIFCDEQFLVPPLATFPEPSINQASQTAVQQHRAQFISTSRILKQRHRIEWLPLTKVHYNWKEKSFSYFVYGQENRVETKDYPSTCCCVIL